MIQQPLDMRFEVVRAIKAFRFNTAALPNGGGTGPGR